MAASGSAVVTGAIINIVVTLIALLVFCFLRLWHKSDQFYDPKRRNADISVKPYALPASRLGWIMPTMRYSEPDVINACGLDTAIYLRLLSFGTQLFIFVSIWCLAVVLPVNYTDNEVDTLMSNPDGNYAFTDFDKLSLSNVSGGSPRLWVHVFSVWLISGITLWLLWRFSRDSVLLRIQFLGNSIRSGPTHSVLVTDIPAVMEATHEAAKHREQLDKEQRKVEKAEAKKAKKLKNKAGRGSSPSEIPFMAGQPSVAVDPETAPTTTTVTPAASALPKTLIAHEEVAEGEVHIEVPPPTDPTVSQPPRASASGTGASNAAAPTAHITNVQGGEDMEKGGAMKPPASSLSSLAGAGGDGVNDVAGAEMGKGGAEGGVRKRRVHFNYDLPMPSLDPKYMAKEELLNGVSPHMLVENEFKMVYGPEWVEAVQLVYDMSGLKKLVPEYEQRKQQLEDYLDAVRYKQANNLPLELPKVTLLFPDAWCKERYGATCGIFKKVDGLPFWRDRLLYLEDEIVKAQTVAHQLIWPSAFVTYKTRLAQSVSATGLHQHDEQTWVVRNAPEPRETIWENLGMTSSTRTTRASLMLVLFWLMTLFYMIPVGAIQGLIDVDKLAKSPGLKAFLNNVVINKLIQAIVPGLVLKIFLALVPAILAFMMRMGGAVSLSEVDFGVVSRFFIFQLVVVFAGNTLASSFFSQAQQWVSNPTSVISVLGTAIPQACTFFITYMWILLASIAIGFLRIVGLVLSWVFMWLAGSPRAQRRVYEEQYTTYGTIVTQHTMSILLGIVFSCINPIITPSVLVYFAVASLVEKYNNIYVYRRNYESGGQLWSRLLNQIMVALYIFQICMIGLLAIKKFPYTVIILPVLLPTVIFHRVVLKLFARPWHIMSLHDAAELDRNDKAVELEEGPIPTDPLQYVPPGFKIHRGDLTEVLTDAHNIEPIVSEDVKRQAADKAAKKQAKKAGKASK